MAIVEHKLITADEFFLMPPPADGSKVELVRGEVVPVCRPGFRHGRRQLRIGGILDHYGRSTKHGRAVVETGIVTTRDPDTVRGPDVSYWSAERLPLDQEPVGYPETSPDLVVEVLSPNNEMAKIRVKMRECFERGVRMIWVVDPEDQTVAVYRSMDEGRIFHESATLSGEDVLPGFTCRVTELFE
jgi:Uma2 family endonuclease